MTKQSKKVIRKEQCPSCLDSGNDNLAVYEDGGTWCFGCSSGGGGKPKKSTQFVDGACDALSTRGIKEETCRKADYQVGQFSGKLGKGYVKDHWVQIANYKKNGKTVAQKIRDQDKNMAIFGDAKAMGLYGMDDYTPTDKLYVTITEGEIDRLSVMQAMGLQYPVVSLSKGAQGAVKEIKEHLNWLMGFKYVVLAFDNDDAGQEATKKVLDLFEVDKVRVAVWPSKDANELTMEGREKEIETTIWNAKSVAPDNLVTVKDIKDKALLQPSFGSSYPWEAMTKITYGYQHGEIHIIVAANGIGKTEFVKDLMFHVIDKDINVGLFSFEQDPEDTLRRLVGAKMGLKLHLPGTKWDADVISKELDLLDGKIYLCDRAGSISHEELFKGIRYLVKAKGVKFVVIDNIRGLGIGHDVELAGSFMRKLQTLCRTLKVSVYLLSHVAKDKYTTQVYTSTSPKNKDAYDAQTAEDVEKAVKKPGMDWESGRMPTTVNIDGPSVFGDLANYIWALARNKVSEDSRESRTLRVKALKTRLDGTFTGSVFKLYYNDRGVLEEVGSVNFNEAQEEGPY